MCLDFHCVWTQVWARPLTGSRVAVAAFNRGGVLLDTELFSPEDIVVAFSDFGAAASSCYAVQDVWRNISLGQHHAQITLPQVVPHDLALLVMTPC